MVLLSYSLACYATDRCVLMASAVLPHVGGGGNTAYTYYIMYGWGVVRVVLTIIGMVRQFHVKY